MTRTTRSASTSSKGAAQRIVPTIPLSSPEKLRSDLAAFFMTHPDIKWGDVAYCCHISQSVVERFLRTGKASVGTLSMLSAFLSNRRINESLPRIRRRKPLDMVKLQKILSPPPS